MTTFNESDALEHTAGDEDLLREVLRFSLEDLPVLLDEVSVALKEERWTDASRLSHKIKGSAGACGSQLLYMAALDLELACRDRDNNPGRFLPLLLKAFRTFRDHPEVRRLSSP